MRFLGGLVSDDIESQDFTAGPFGSGFVVKRAYRSIARHTVVERLREAE